MDANTRGSDLKECDLVMKGGITSGVVYPQAVLALKDRYRFRNIGGGSVGAVAAALTAAAELGRDGASELGGFEGMRNAQNKLAEERGYLQALFRPPDTYKPLMDVALALARLGKDAEGLRLSRVAFFRQTKSATKQSNPGTYRKGTLWGAVLGVGTGALLGILVGVILYLLFFSIVGQTAAFLSGGALVFLVSTPAFVLGLLLGSFFGWLGGPTLAAYGLLQLATNKMPADNFYGMCIGSGEPGTLDQPLLTDWLSGLLNDLAGIGDDRPLTFGHLRDAHVKGKKPEEPGIALKMLTTNLNHKEPYLFPREANTFLFKEEDMKRFFPAAVFQYMCEHSADAGVEPPEGFRFLPQGDDLPVIVPVRMAIGFPVLLSTVPLYTISETALVRLKENPAGSLTEEDLQRNLFSDGGICSNFPIHFFDAWLPRRPTFGINLTSVYEEVDRGAAEGETAAFSASDTVADASSTQATDTRTGRIKSPTEPWLPRPDDPDSREWTSFKGLVGFFGAILATAMNYRDTMQSRLPSYQERVVQVPLRAQEGGLNLDMEPEVIETISRRGKRAGEMLLSFDFDRHRWVRLRVLLGELEKQLEGTREALRSVIDEDLVEVQLAGGFPYHFEDNQKRRSEDAKELLRRLEELVEYLDRRPGDRFPPIPNEDPQPALRITPNI
jgi:hypothetical protein